MSTPQQAMRKRLIAQYETFTPQEIADLVAPPPVGAGLVTYDDVRDARRAAMYRHFATMQVPAELEAFRRTMTRRFGPTVTVWKHDKVDWLIALLIGLYGEEPAHWPATFDTRDIQRAERFTRRGTAFKGLVFEDVPDGFARIEVALVTAIGFLLSPIVLGIVRLTAMLTAIVAVIWSSHLGWLQFPDAMLFVSASALSNFWENKFIDNYFRNRQTTAPAAMHVALYTAAPGETGGGTEVSGGSYARVNYGVGATVWEGTGGETTAVDSAGTGGATQNINAITFPAPTANWGVITHTAILDASVSGNVLVYGALAANKTVNNGDAAPNFPAGAFDFSIA